MCLCLEGHGHYYIMSFEFVPIPRHSLAIGSAIWYHNCVWNPKKGRIQNDGQNAVENHAGGLRGVCRRGAVRAWRGRVIQGRREDQELGRLGRQGAARRRHERDRSEEGAQVRHMGEAQQARPRPQGDRTPRGARREGREVLQVVRRLRDDGPRLCRLERLQAPRRTARCEAWPPLLRLGEDRAGEGQVRFLVVRPPGARNGGDGREALDLPCVRQSRLRKRLPPRHEGKAGDGQARGVRRVDQVLCRVRGALQGRGRRVGDLERAVRAGPRIR